jgi:hypothetical protein
MIIRVVRGTSFKACLKYLLKKPLAKVLMTHGLLGETPEAWLWEFEAEAYDSTKVILPVYHLAIALHPQDNPKATDTLFCDLAQSIVEALEIAHHQWLLVRHFDTPHAHVHLMLNRVYQGKATSQEYDHTKLQAIARNLENTHQLQAPKHRLTPQQLKLPKKFQTSEGSQPPTKPPARQTLGLGDALPSWQPSWKPWQRLLKGIASQQYQQGCLGFPSKLVRPEALSQALIDELQSMVHQQLLPLLYQQLSPQRLPNAMVQALMYWMLQARLRGYATWITREKQQDKTVPDSAWHVMHNLGWRRDSLAKLLCHTMQSDTQKADTEKALHDTPESLWKMTTTRLVRLQHRARKAVLPPKRRKPYMIDWGFRIGRAVHRFMMLETMRHQLIQTSQEARHVTAPQRHEAVLRHYHQAMQHAYGLWVHGVVSTQHPLVAWGMPIWYKTHWGQLPVRYCWAMQRLIVEAWLAQVC